MKFEYWVPEEWYHGLYSDKAPLCKASRPFSLVHSSESAGSAWLKDGITAKKAALLVHGYTGYPGELVRPAADLYSAGFDVFVPRLPGHGTSGADFIKSSSQDWLGLVENAVSSLLSRYDSVSILGHSMGSLLAVISAAEHPQLEKVILAAPAFAHTSLRPASLAGLRFLSLFRKSIPTEWKPVPEYNMHYEGAPADDIHLGSEYWSKLFPRGLTRLYRLMKQAPECLARYCSLSGKGRVLALIPELDAEISVPSRKVMETAAGDAVEFVTVPNGTHYLFYDKDPAAEEFAVKAVLDFILCAPQDARSYR